MKDPSPPSSGAQDDEEGSTVQRSTEVSGWFIMKMKLGQLRGTPFGAEVIGLRQKGAFQL